MIDPKAIKPGDRLLIEVTACQTTTGTKGTCIAQSGGIVFVASDLNGRALVTLESVKGHTPAPRKAKAGDVIGVGNHRWTLLNVAPIKNVGGRTRWFASYVYLSGSSVAYPVGSHVDFDDEECTKISGGLGLGFLE